MDLRAIIEQHDEKLREHDERLRLVEVSIAGHEERIKHLEKLEDDVISLNTRLMNMIEKQNKEYNKIIRAILIKILVITGSIVSLVYLLIQKGL